MSQETSHLARFNPLIRPYLVLQVGLVLALTVVGIPFALLWFCGIGQWWARHYFDRLQCELSPRSLRFRKGILFQLEKTIPLENIQDVTFIEGPVLRYFNLSLLKFETAGQGGAASAQMQLIGIIDAHAFRGQILAARDALRQPKQDSSQALLQRIADRLDQIGAALDRAVQANQPAASSRNVIQE